MCRISLDSVVHNLFWPVIDFETNVLLFKNILLINLLNTCDEQHVSL